MWRRKRFRPRFVEVSDQDAINYLHRVNNDHYGILGVAQSATDAEIKEQFRFLSHAYHPDKFATESQRKTAEEHFKKINEAYHILSDPASRTRYDASRAGSSDAPPHTSDQHPTAAIPHARKQSGSFQIIKWAFIVTAVFAVIAAFVIYDSERRQNIKFQTSKRRIASSEIELVDLALRPSSGSSYQLEGRIRNRSPEYTLSSVMVKVTMRDILPFGEAEVVGEDKVYLTARVPAGQTRGVTSHVSFAHLPKPLGRFEWSYTILETWAE